jgi:DUF4097 and DUF4098 domain-containing protein YvlB
MDEERTRILKMLEEGKITAPEAEKLLLALKSSPRPETMSRDEIRMRMHRHGLHGMRRMPEIMSHVVEDMEDSLDSAVRRQRLDFVSRGKLLLRNVSGDTEVQGWDRPTVQFGREPGALWRANERDGMIMAKALTGDLRVKVPHETALVVNSVSGDLEVEDVRGKIEVRSVSGDVELRRVGGHVSLATTSGDIKTRDLGGKCHVTSVSGDVDMGILGTLSGFVETRSGDILVWVPSNANLLLEAEIVEDGDIENEAAIQHEKLDDADQHVILGFGAKEHHLWLKCRVGDIVVRSYEAPAVPAGQPAPAEAPDEPEGPEESEEPEETEEPEEEK